MKNKKNHIHTSQLEAAHPSHTKFQVERMKHNTLNITWPNRKIKNTKMLHRDFLLLIWYFFFRFWDRESRTLPVASTLNIRLFFQHSSNRYLYGNQSYGFLFSFLLLYFDVAYPWRVVNPQKDKRIVCVRERTSFSIQYCFHFSFV